jgi:predicted nucleic acid-binding protein
MLLAFRRFLVMVGTYKNTTYDLIGTLGTPQDDYTNTFTARLLLLLESKPLLGADVHTDIAEEIIEKYWIDYPDHSSDFRPTFLANDILRLWRTLCVNYEAFTQREPRHLRAKRRLQKYKLAHSRLLTCYSAILNLLFLYGNNKTVSPSDALQLFQTTPTERIERLAKEVNSDSIRETFRAILERYDKFLTETNAAESDLITRFERMEFRQAAVQASREFGDLVFRALEQLGEGNAFYRMIVV